MIAVLKECQVRVFHKSVMQECPQRVSSRSVSKECEARVSHKIVKRECPQRVSSKSVSHKSVKQESQASRSMDKTWHAFGLVASILFYSPNSVATLRGCYGNS